MRLSGKERRLLQPELAPVREDASTSDSRHRPVVTRAMVPSNRWLMDDFKANAVPNSVVSFVKKVRPCLQKNKWNRYLDMEHDDPVGSRQMQSCTCTCTLASSPSCYFAWESCALVVCGAFTLCQTCSWSENFLSLWSKDLSLCTQGLYPRTLCHLYLKSINWLRLLMPPAQVTLFAQSFSQSLSHSMSQFLSHFLTFNNCTGLT